MRLITALELASNYPENILINSVKDENGKFAAFCYITRDGNIHKLMLSTQPVFESDEAAKKTLKDIAIACKEKYSD